MNCDAPIVFFIAPQGHHNRPEQAISSNRGLNFTGAVAFCNSPFFAARMGPQFSLSSFSLACYTCDKASGNGAAAKRYRVRALCGVGMWQTGTQADSVRGKMNVPEEIPVFTLQGGFDLNKLHGLYHFLMVLVVKTAGKRLAAKTQRTPEEDDVLDWYNGQK